MRTNSNLARVGSLVLCALTAAAAAPRQAADAPIAPDLKARVEQYWTLKQQKDLGGMYELYGSAYRAEVSRTDFLAMTRLVRYPILSFAVTGATIDGDRAEVTVAYETEVPVQNIPRYATDVTHTWVREDGQWWKAEEELLMPVP
jgi:hypothetical protein